MNSPDATPIPALPDHVEAWILAAIDDDSAEAVHVSRRATSRHVRLGTWSRKTSGDLGQWVVDQVRTHVVGNGNGTYQLARTGVDAVEWRATLPATAVDFAGDDLRSLMQSAWDLTFRMADDMRQTYAVLPRLMTPIIDLMKETLTERREAARESSDVTLAAIETDATTKRLDRLEGLAKMVMHHDEKAPPVTKRGAADSAREILSVLTDDERSAVLSTRAGQALALARDIGELTRAVTDAWAAKDRGEFSLSSDTISKIKAVIRALNGDA